MYIYIYIYTHIYVYIYIYIHTLYYTRPASGSCGQPAPIAATGAPIELARDKCKLSISGTKYITSIHIHIHVHIYHTIHIPRALHLS